MSQQHDAHATPEAATDASARGGAIRRLFNAWRRWEKRMDYGPYDYTLDRIGNLESRVMELERARNTTRGLTIAPDGVAYKGTSTESDEAGSG